MVIFVIIGKLVMVFNFFFYEIKEILCINEFIDKYVLFKVYKVRDLGWLVGFSYNWLIISIVWYYIFKKFMYIINDLLLNIIVFIF